MQVIRFLPSATLILIACAASALAAQSNFTITVQTTGGSTIGAHDGNTILALGHTWSLSGPDDTDDFTGADLVLDGRVTDWHGTALTWDGTTLTLAYHGPYDFTTQPVIEVVSPPPGTTITPSSGGSLTTSDGVWTFSASLGGGGNLILLNGASAAGGSGVLLEIANSGHMYAQANDSTWWEWTGSGWMSVTAPAVQTVQTAPAGVAATPTPYSMAITADNVAGTQPFGKFM